MDSSSQKEEIVADPFAADIFAAKQKNVGEATPEIDSPVDSRWTRRLPKLAPARIRWSELLNNLPPDFSDELPRHLTGALENLLALPPENKIELAPLAAKEINRAEDFPPASSDSWWLNVGIEQSSAEIAFEIDNAFAVWLVDAMLGEEVSGQIRPRDLTPTETAVLEFLALNLIYEANRALQSPLFKIRSLRRQIPDWLANAKTNFAAGDSLLAINRQIICDSLASVVKIYLAPASLKNLQAKENALLDSAPRRRAGWRRFQSQIKDAPLRLSIGEAELTYAELASLEIGDVVLLKNYDLTLFGGNLFGRAELFLGDGENAKIAGEILAPETTVLEKFEESGASDDNKILIRQFAANHVWKFVITDLAETKNPPTVGQSMTETDENFNDETEAENADETGGLAVENLALTLRVEMEARRLTLSEIADLRENQILELGVRPTDTVNLLIENRVVGRGELVEIEERLGVRITKLLR